MRRPLLGAAVLAALLGLLAAPGSADRSAGRRWCRHLPRWTVYYAGAAVGAHHAEEADVDCTKYPDVPATGDVTYLYGTCKVSGGDEGGCEPPIEVESEPLCQDRPAVYGTGGAPQRRGHARGVPTASWPEDNRLELYTRTTTIAIYAWKRSLMRKVVKRLHLAPGYNLPRRGHPRRSFRREAHPRSHYGRLPAPTPHAFRTRKSCS